MDVAILAVSVGKDFNHFGMLAAIDYWFDSRIKKIYEKKYDAIILAKACLLYTSPSPRDS